MSTMKIPGISDDYFVVKSSGLSQFQAMTAYLGGSAFQTVCDNPVTAYRQLVQQYAKDAAGKPVDPKIASEEAKAVFRAHPLSASMSGVGPRLVGVGFKRVPKFGTLLGISFFLGEGESPGPIAATGASILSAPFINPIRMIEKQQVSGQHSHVLSNLCARYLQTCLLIRFLLLKNCFVIACILQTNWSRQTNQ
jgi:hypothetical protein